MANIFENTPLMDLLNRMKGLSEDQLFIDVISEEETKKYIVDLNTGQMKDQYIDSKGRLLADIGGGYSDFTMATGKKAGKFKVDLYDTGEFHESFRVESITGKGFEIKSDPIKDDGTNLLQEWGEDIEGLTLESMDKLVQYMIPLYIQWIRNKLGI